MRELKTGLNADKLAKLFPNSSPNFTVVWSISVFLLVWRSLNYNLGFLSGLFVDYFAVLLAFLKLICVWKFLFVLNCLKLVACCFIILFMVKCCGGFFYWTSHRVVLLSQAFQDSRFHKQLLSRFCVPRANISLIMESGFPHIRRHSPGDKTDIKKRKLA